MTDRQEPSAFDDPTRDIRLGPLPDRPPPKLPAGWSPDLSAPPPRTPPTAAEVPARPTGRPDAGPAMEEQPTDELAHRTAKPREPTLAFSSPEMSRRPVGRVSVRPARRWPWVLLVLLPVLVIAGTAVALLLLLQGA